MAADSALIKDLHAADLRYSSDSTKGITRKRNGAYFTYFDTDGKRIESEQVLERMKQLAIPPAWDDVWICPSPTGYLQATGYDEKKRKQYMYHTDWTKRMQENKFSKIPDFAVVLPKIRQTVRRDMESEELDKEKILATVIWLLEHTLIRIGNEEYAKENDSYGLTTLRNKHVKVHGKNVTFEFTGKSGIEHTVSITNPKIAKIIKQCFELPGYEIFQYIDGDNKRTIDSQSVNEYLKQITNEDITAKEFRTWGGTVLGGTTLFGFGTAIDEKSIKKNLVETVKKVSQHLRNTAAVCRKYYIHPTIFETYEKNLLVPHFEKVYADFDSKKTQLTRPEYAVLTLLEKYS